MTRTKVNKNIMPRDLFRAESSMDSVERFQLFLECDALRSRLRRATDGVGKRAGVEITPELIIGEGDIHLSADVRNGSETSAFPFKATPKINAGQEFVQILDDNELMAVVAHEIEHFQSDTVYREIKNFRGMAVAMAWALYLRIANAMLPCVIKPRETKADEYSAALTGHPEHLISALIKLHAYVGVHFGSKRELRKLRLHSEELKRILPDVDLESEVFQRAEKETAIERLRRLIFSPHPSLSGRILSLLEFKPHKEA